MSNLAGTASINQAELLARQAVGMSLCSEVFGTGGAGKLFHSLTVQLTPDLLELIDRLCTLVRTEGLYVAKKHFSFTLAGDSTLKLQGAAVTENFFWFEGCTLSGLDLETEPVYFEELLAEVARWHHKNLPVPLSVLSTTSMVNRRNKVQSLVREGIYPEALQADIVDEAAFA
jgi:hypothetical protein